jgi:hypothetical protein
MAGRRPTAAASATAGGDADSISTSGVGAQDRATRSDRLPSLIEQAQREFGRTLAELGVESGDATAIGRRAAMMVMAPSAWRRRLDPLITLEDARRRLRLRKPEIEDLLRQRGLIALPGEHGTFLVPEMQLSLEAHAVFSEVPGVIAIFDEVGLDDFGIAAWLMTAQSLLDGMSPAEFLRKGHDGTLVLTAARRSARKIAH